MVLEKLQEQFFRILSLLLLMALIVNYNDLIYNPNLFGLNYYYQIYAAPTLLSSKYEIIKIICGLIRFIVIFIFIYILWDIKRSKNKIDLIVNFFQKNNNKKIKNYYPLLVLSIYITFIYLMKNYFPNMQQIVGAYGVVTTWNLFSDFGILDLNVFCYQNGQSPYARLPCNHGLGMNYSMLWVYFLNLIGFGSNSTVILDSHPYYLIIAIILVIFFVSIYYFINDKFLSKVYLVMLISSPIQTLYFQHNNDLFCIFIFVLGCYLIKKIKLVEKNNYYYLFLLFILSLLKVIFLPVIIFYSLYIYFSKKNNISPHKLILLPLLSVAVNFYYLSYIVKFTNIPMSYTYGLRNIILISKNYNFRMDNYENLNQLVDLFGHALHSTQMDKLYFSGYIIFIAGVICILLNLKIIYKYAKLYSDALMQYISLENQSRRMELTFGIIYIITYLAMPSYNLRLWCLIGAVVCTCLNIVAIKNNILNIKNEVMLELNQALSRLYVLTPTGSIIALYISPFPVFYFYTSELIFMIFFFFYSIHTANIFIGNIRNKRAYS
jgi:hypothetical protein